MSDNTDNRSKTGSAGEPQKEPATGKVHPDAAKAGDVAAAAAKPSVAQGLQSVMAVIGENYDPAVSGAVDKAATPKPETSAAPASKLTDKIDAARLKQTEGSSVTQGLQSIMAVIGENYEEDGAEESAPAPRTEPQPTPPPAAAVPARTPSAAPQDRQNVEATNAISDLLPLLTSDEQDIARTHHQVVVSEEELPASASTAVVSTESTIADLLNQLKSDIRTLEKGSITARQQFNMPEVIDTASNEVRTLLAELQGDISALRSENDALKAQYNVPSAVAATGQGSEIAMLLSQLQGDIVGLRQENDALKSKYGIAASAGGGEISQLLAQLQGDISGLRQENDSFKAYYNVPDGRPRGTSIGQAFLMTIGLLALVGGATIGGMYYANRMNDRNNENMLALLGLQQSRNQKQIAIQPEIVVKKPVVVETVKKVEKPKVVAVAPTPPPPALPKIVVKRPKLDSAEVQALLADAQNLIELGDLISARQMLEYAMSQKSAEAAYRLAQTFDPLYLATMASVLSVEPSITRAKVLYYSAARQGHQAASKRLAELRRTPAN
jgi:hypothetical protein